MQDKEILVKTIRKRFTDKLKAGEMWFKFITAVNDIKLAKRELELMSFINVRGTISSTSAKNEFCNLFGSSNATISNMVSTLTELKLLVKENGKTRVNPTLKVDFERDLVIRFYMSVGKEIQPEEVKDEVDK